MSKRQSTLNEVERNTNKLRELLDQHQINGTLSEMSDDVKVCASSRKKKNHKITHGLCRPLLANNLYCYDCAKLNFLRF